MVMISWNTFITINRFILGYFYDQKYLRGRYFDKNLVGWKWAWKGLLWQKILGFNRHVKWPVTSLSKVTNPVRISFNPNDLQIFQSNGCYFQCIGDIEIGVGSYIAPNVGLITANHDLFDLDKHMEPGKITIGKNCWIGMNVVILPGVTLGEKTIVAAGAVVNKSFGKGNCVIGGVPAKVIKVLD